jgi:hypothetical protein
MTPVLPVRIVMAVCGCLAIAWGATTLPIFWRSAPLAQTAASIINQVPYKAESLEALLPVVADFEQSSSCTPAALRSSAIIQLRRLEEGYGPDQVAELDDRLAAADNAIRRSLECSPADPFLWLVLYSVESTRNGARDEYLNYISMSYRLGPREGWIAVQRNRVAMTIFPRLPSDVAEMALAEFAELVQSRLYDGAVGTLLGPGWAIRDRLLARLADIDERERSEFASRLNERGVNLPIPGVAAPGQRPWH